MRRQDEVETKFANTCIVRHGHGKEEGSRARGHVKRVAAGRRFDCGEGRDGWLCINSPLYHCCSSFLSKWVDFCSSTSCSWESFDCLERVQEHRGNEVSKLTSLGEA